MGTWVGTLELDRKPNPKFVHFARCEPHAVGDQLDFINFNPLTHYSWLIKSYFSNEIN